MIFRFVGLKNSRLISSFIFKRLGSIFRSNKMSLNNLSIAFPNLSENEKKKNCKTNVGKLWKNFF